MMKRVLLMALLSLFFHGICHGQTQEPKPILMTPTPVRLFELVEDKDGNPVEHCLIKGNINSKGDRIYHCPMWRDYDKTVIDEENGERWFCTEEEAIEAGWRAPKYATGPCR